jgi:hypothetical protein
MNKSLQITLGDLVVALFDETEKLKWLGAGERKLLVAFIVNDITQRSILKTIRNQGVGR